MQYKSIDVKASENGTIEGYFSTWTREPDAYGDVVAKGAFAESFERIRENGGTVPFLWGHQSEDLNSYIGTAGDFKEDDHGAYFKATFDATDQAQRARELVKDGRIAKFSFAYEILDQGEVELEDGRKANELRKLELYEVSLVMYPANPDTSVIDVKSGRRNSAADEKSLKNIAELAARIQSEVDGLLAVDEPKTGAEPQGEASAEGQCDQGAFVGAYKQAIKQLLGV